MKPLERLFPKNIKLKITLQSFSFSQNAASQFQLIKICFLEILTRCMIIRSSAQTFKTKFIEFFSLLSVNNLFFSAYLINFCNNGSWFCSHWCYSSNFAFAINVMMGQFKIQLFIYIFHFHLYFGHDFLELCEQTVLIYFLKSIYSGFTRAYATLSSSLIFFPCLLQYLSSQIIQYIEMGNG